ncbi:hypothetical protein DEO72_LG2g3772 [Vigna unguiculata]|nr:hypothetical protein DEO72_LG2g3772 [Vigna unguiculata]
MSQDYQTRQPTTEEGNLSGPIRTGHNQHTHTGNTHQPELNSRVSRVHPSSRAQLEGCYSELNLRNRGTRTARRYPLPDRLAGDTHRQAPSTSRTIKFATTARRNHFYRQADAVSGTTIFLTIAWRNLPAARRLLHQNLIVASLPPGGSNSVVKRCISTYAVLVLVKYSSHLTLAPILNPLYS